MITTSLQATSSRPPYLHPRPTTKADAIRNLQAFSTEYLQRRPPPNFKRFEPDTLVNSCLGWTMLNGPKVHSVLQKLGASGPCLREATSYFAIVYAFVPEGTLDEKTIQAQLDFFYLTGFVCAPVREGNWRSSGVLVDFSDIISPLAPGWDSFKYGRMVKTELGFYDLEGKS